MCRRACSTSAATATVVRGWEQLQTQVAVRVLVVRLLAAKYCWALLMLSPCPVVGVSPCPAWVPDPLIASSPRQPASLAQQQQQHPVRLPLPPLAQQQPVRLPLPPLAGEVTLQSFMLLYGAWIPQEVARAAGDGELLLEVRLSLAAVLACALRHLRLHNPAAGWLVSEGSRSV